MRSTAIALLFAGGCSFALVRTQPPCSPAPAYADTVIAAALAAASLYRLSSHASDQAAGEAIGEGAAFGAGAGVFAISAIYGFVKTSSCPAGR